MNEDIPESKLIKNFVLHSFKKKPAIIDGNKRQWYKRGIFKSSHSVLGTTEETKIITYEYMIELEKNLKMWERI